jgi:transposase-like protein
MCEQLDESVGAFRTRALDRIAFPYVYLDATHLHVRNKPGKGGQVVSMAVVVPPFTRRRDGCSGPHEDRLVASGPS